MGLSQCRLAPCVGAGGAALSSSPNLLGIVGWSGSGKTTLVARLIPRLRALGVRVSTIKHAHHGLDMDRPGKDSFVHREAGAEEVLVVGGQRWALLRETQGVPDLAALAARLAPVDLILAEGFKNYPFAKLEVYRPALGKPPLWPDSAGIVAVASDAAAPADCPYPWLPLNAAEKIAAWIAAHRIVSYTVS